MWIYGNKNKFRNEMSSEDLSSENEKQENVIFDRFKFKIFATLDFSFSLCFFSIFTRVMRNIYSYTFLPPVWQFVDAASLKILSFFPRTVKTMSSERSLVWWVGRMD